MTRSINGAAYAPITWVEANLDLAEEYAGYPGFYPGWYWAGYPFGYTWLPGAGLFWNPFGYGFYSPYYLYGGGFIYGRYGDGVYPYHGGYAVAGALEAVVASTEPA